MNFKWAVVRGLWRRISAGLRRWFGESIRVHGIVKADALLHGKETVVYGDTGSRGIQKRTSAKAVEWTVAMCPGKRAALDKDDALDRIVNESDTFRQACEPR